MSNFPCLHKVRASRTRKNRCLVRMWRQHTHVEIRCLLSCGEGDINKT